MSCLTVQLLFVGVALMIMGTNGRVADTKPNKIYKSPEKLFLQTRQRSKDFTCGVPQDRCISFGKLYNEHKNINETGLPNLYALKDIQPPCGLVRRCGSDTGCCMGEASSMSCGRAKHEHVSLIFKTFHSDNRNKEYVTLRVVNDLSCSCS